MNNKYYLFFAGLLITAILNIQSIKKIPQPPLKMTGAPQEQTCGNQYCHNTTPNKESGNIELGIQQQNYKPGDSIIFEVKLNDATASVYGFELTALNENNEKAGSFTIINGNGTVRISSDNGRQYASHKNASSNNTWKIKWKAPESNMDTVTFYAAGNGGNDNSKPTGDHIYTTSLSLASDGTAGLFSYNKNTSEGKIFPNSAKNHFHYKLSGNFMSSPMHCKIFNIKGEKVSSQKIKSLQGTINIKDLKSGQYLVKFINDKNVITKKLIK